jgi:hypothetical protein
MACGARAKLACVQWHGGLLRGPAGLQPSGLPAQPSRADSPRRRCHTLGAGTVPCTCLRRRCGAPAEGSPAAVAEEGFRGGHQRSEGMAPGKARAMGAHRRWPARVRGGAGSSGWHSRVSCCQVYTLARLSIDSNLCDTLGYGWWLVHRI